MNKRKVIVSVIFHGKYFYRMAWGRILANGKTEVSRNTLDSLLKEAGVKRGQTYRT